jgi:hypothetical protein
MEIVLPKLETIEQIDKLYDEWVEKNLESTNKSFDIHIRNNFSILHLFEYMKSYIEVDNAYSIYQYFRNLVVMYNMDNMDNMGTNLTMIVGNVSDKISYTLSDIPIVESDTTTNDTAKTKPHNHYFKECPYDNIDVYRLILLYNITDPCIQHAFKKLLVAGARGHKNIDKDIQDVIDTLLRWQNMKKEDEKLIDK